MRIDVVARSQRIEVEPSTQVVSVINAGPMGPPGLGLDAPVVLSDIVDDIVEISQAAYDALGAGRPSSRLYLITS